MDMGTKQAKPRARALSLLSGGLDSMLAICVLKEQGVEVHAVVYDSPFFNAERGLRAADQLNVPVHVLDFLPELVPLLEDPPHGFGKCMNPCIDCHAAMLRQAGRLMETMGFDFLSTGEVLNQRPMSQNRQSLALVAKSSGYGEVVVRPLSARLLPETRPEREGLVDRERLLGLSGRNRKPQMELAEKYGITDYPSPAGGCRLTDPNFARRLRDLKEHEGLRDARAISWLRVGRHFRLEGGVKLILGRNRADNLYLEENAAAREIILKPEGVPGPSGLLPATATDEQIERAARICARYSDAEPAQAVTIRIRSATDERRIQVEPLPPESVAPYRIQ